ncbi:MAG: glycoside hydrolase family 2 TIM barrel-domain containing protein, partial [Spirochaetaceae bacterium]|nr:glycoside hydrolase family 2 TIM barrel-domain containing protein [Spirochaetaceae bacterium]
MRVDNSDAPNCRWYSGSGIYRRARLAYHGEFWITPHGLSVTIPRVSARRAEVRVAIEAHDGRTAGGHDGAVDASDRSRAVDAEVAIIAPDGAEIVRITRSLGQGPAGTASGVFEVVVGSPELWSAEAPALYRIEARLLAEGRTVDEACASFGVRKAEFRPGRGFFLNGEETKLKGVCLHGDGGAVGAAVPMAVWRRRLGRLKEIGCNAIRCAHNPPDPQFLDLCDELGFLVIDEVFDKWEGAFSKPEDWYLRQFGFAEVWKEALSSTIKRDRNHPSVILWSVGNETGQPGTDEVDPWLETLCDAAREIDPTRPVTAAFVSSAASEPEEKARRIMKSAEKV